MDQQLTGKEAEHLQNLLDKYFALKAAKEKSETVDQNDSNQADS